MASTATNGNTSYPASIDTADTFGASESRNTINLANWLSRFWAAIIAVQTKVGATGSAVNTTHTYKLSGVADGDKAASLLGAETLDSKTMTNAIITSPAISNPAFSGTPTGLTKSHVGLGNVDNTSDASKPVSTAQQAALDLKANLASPALTGTPTAPTATVGTNTTQIATCAFVLGQGFVTAAGGQVTGTASGSLATGDRVIINSDGTVSKIVGMVGSNGTSTNFPTTTIGSVHGMYDSVSGKVVIIYQTDSGNTGIPKAVVGTISGTSISFGSEVSMTAFFTNTISCCLTGIGSSKILVAYKNFNSSQRGEIICGTISGTSISFGSATVIETVTTNSIGLDWDSTNSKCLIAYYDATNTRVRAAVATVSGTTITVNTPVTVASVSANLVRCVYTQSSNVFVIAYYDSTNTAGRAVVQTVSGTTSSNGTVVSFKAANVSGYLDMCYTTSAKVVIVYQLNSDTSGRAIVGTVSGTAISFGSETTFATGTITGIACAYDSTNAQVQVGYYDGTDGKAIEGSVSGTTISFPNSAVTTTTGKSMYAYGLMYAGSSKFVHGFGSGAAQVIGSFFSNLTASNFVGFSAGNYTNGQTATLNVVSGTDNNGSGMTPGSKYYVQDDGTLSSSATTKPYAGVALTTTRILIKG